MNPPLRILHLITGLNTGGTEIALLRLLEGLPRDKFDSQVVSIIPTGEIGERIQALGIPVRSLNLPPGKPTFGGLRKFISLIKDFQPDVLQTWLYHADLLGLLAAQFVRIPSIIWNIRSAEMDFSQYNRLSGLVFRACAFFSGLPTAIIINSQAGLSIHTQLGYHPKKWNLIPNGIDISKFTPHRKSGVTKRKEWRINPDEIVVGHIGRIDPQKDHDTLLKASAIVQNHNPRVQFVCVGDGPAKYWNEKKDFAANLKLTNLQWAGRQSDMPTIYNALDILVSSSKGEAFPNAVAEAMACEIPCVVTDVGDSKVLVGETGICVPPCQPEALANAILKLAEKPSSDLAEMGVKARQRIAANFSHEKMIQSYTNLYQNMEFHRENITGR